MSTWRAKGATAALRGVNRLSRTLGRGQGTVAGGRVGLRLDPHLLVSLARGRTVVLISGTNGKTTTTALAAAALSATGRTVVTNSTGSNMPAGHVAALAGDPQADLAALEVDEGYLPRVLKETQADAVVLLNLSRDQLDRMSEVRMLAERWRTALFASPTTKVIANADDPLVVFAARDAALVTWVAGGLAWREDATGCPSCGARITFEESGHWSCEGCSLGRPNPSWRLEGMDAVTPGGRVSLDLALPGAFNRDNALLALCAAVSQGSPLDGAALALRAVQGVAGRFVVTERAGHQVRLMLAKNPAGWSALLDLASDDDEPIVVAINARIADGLDPSWLWDVDFSPLSGRRVVASGERWRDLSVRLRYAEVAHLCAEDGLDAISLAGAEGATGVIDVIGNYTAFSDLKESSA